MIVVVVVVVVVVIVADLSRVGSKDLATELFAPRAIICLLSEVRQRGGMVEMEV